MLCDDMKRNNIFSMLYHVSFNKNLCDMVHINPDSEMLQKMLENRISEKVLEGNWEKVLIIP
jgi:hypothetical protein